MKRIGKGGEGKRGGVREEWEERDTERMGTRNVRGERRWNLI